MFIDQTFLYYAGSSEYEEVQMMDMSTLAESAELSKLKQEEEQMSDSEFDLKEMTESDDSDFNR